MECGSFGWTSTTELHEELIENGHISPCGSESDPVTSVKDDDNSADEEEPDVCISFISLIKNIRELLGLILRCRTLQREHSETTKLTTSESRTYCKISSVQV